MRLRKPKNQTAETRPCSPSCQSEFLDTLRLLGARQNSAHIRVVGGIPLEIQPVLLRCWRETWEQFVGKLEEASLRCVCTVPRPFQTWRHPWTGGCVSCVGSLEEDSSGRQWVEINCAIFHLSDTQLDITRRIDGRLCVRTKSRAA